MDDELPAGMTPAEKGKPKVVFFGGFRQGEVAMTVFKGKSNADLIHLNLWCGGGDTLVARMRRAMGILDEADLSSRFIVVGYSMGCHLALRFAQRLAGQQVRQLGLIAPDPKIKRTNLDDVDTFAGNRSAYDEACDLWQSDRPGLAFEKAMKELGPLPRRPILRYCTSDEVAEFDGNVERLTEVDGWDIVEVPLATLRELDVHVSEHWVHDAMVGMIRRVLQPTEDEDDG